MHPFITARLFIVFTTQRSGSSWTMDLLGTQEGIGIPTMKESMLPTHRANQEHWPAFKWASWRDEAERAFANVVASNPAAHAVGWKLMYDQVPAKMILIVRYHGCATRLACCTVWVPHRPRALSIYQVPAKLIGPFVEWVRNSSIRVVHLVREASLLRHLSSDEAHRTKYYHSTLSGGKLTANLATRRRLSGSGAPVRIELENARHIFQPP